MTIAYGLGLSMSAELAFNLGTQSAIDGGRGGENITPQSFVTSWKTDNSGTSDSNQIRLPLLDTAIGNSYDFIVQWGDGSMDHITAYDQAEVVHTYASAGTYQVVITGTCIGWSFKLIGDCEKLLNISQWGSLRLGRTIGNTGGYFGSCSNLTITATDILDLTGVNSLNQAFAFCYSLTTIPSANSWDISGITNLASTFGSCPLFNQDIGAWNVINVTTISDILAGASSFNQDISGWQTSSVTTALQAFKDATSFNQNIGLWPVSKLANAQEMLSGATAFNQNLGAWNVTSLTTATYMLTNVTLSTANYEALLTGWGNQALHSGVIFDGGNSQYTGLSVAAGSRDHMTNGFGWTITDGGAINTLTSIAFWVDGSKSSTITKAYQDMVETGSGTISTHTITASATVNNKVQPGMKIRIGGTNIYTVSSISSTVITTVEALTSTYGAGSALALDRLSQWNDLSGNTYNATQATALKQPIYTPARLNTNMSTITGDAASTMVLVSGLYSIPNGANTVICLSNRTLHDAFERRTIAMTKASSQRYQLAYTVTRDQVSFLSNSASTTAVTITDTPEDAFQALVATRSGVTQSIQIDSGTPATNSSGGDEPAIDAAAIFSNGIGTSAFFVGNIAEMLVFSRALSGTEITQVLAYLVAKWQYNVPPSNVVTASSQSVIGQYGYFITAS